MNNSDNMRPQSEAWEQGKKIAKLIHSIFIKYKFFILILTIVCSICIGCVYLGPFIDSDIYKWLNNEIQSNRLVNNLIDVEDVLMDGIIHSTLPLAIYWAIILFYYHFNKSVNEVNKVIKYTSWVASGTGFWFIIFGSTLFGITLYFINKYGCEKKLLFGFIISIVIFYIGILTKNVSKTLLYENKNLNKYAFYIALLLTIYAIIVYFYGIFSEPIRLWFIIQNSYPKT